MNLRSNLACPVLQESSCFLLLLSLLWVCGQRVWVVQAKRHIHRPRRRLDFVHAAAPHRNWRLVVHRLVRAPKIVEGHPGTDAGPRLEPSAYAFRCTSSYLIERHKTKKPVFDFAVVDEAQDITVAHARFFAALGGGRRNALFFAGDLGQRIFQQPFSWKALGVDIRGRSRTLRVNYRTSHQIRTQADRLLGTVVTDVDGNREDRSDTVSVFNGPLPMVRSLKSENEEAAFVGNWIAARAKEGVAPHEFGVFVRSPRQLDRASVAVKAAGLSFKILDEQVETVNPSYSRRPLISCLGGFWDLGAQGFVRFFHRLATDTFANALEG